MDTGLLCYLVGWKTPETARNGAMSGGIFETFAVSEIIKSFMNAGTDLNDIYYYRDKDKKEIDLLIVDGETIYPVEIKKGSAVSRDWTKNFAVLKSIKDKKVQRGTVVCLADKVYTLPDSSLAVPIGYI